MGGLRDLTVADDTLATPIYDSTIESKVGKIVKSGFLVKKGRMTRNIQTYKRANKQTNEQTNKQTNKQARLGTCKRKNRKLCYSFQGPVKSGKVCILF